MNKILDEKLNVSLNDIVVILISSWKRLVIAGLLGAFLGISYYFFLGTIHQYLELLILIQIFIIMSLIIETLLVY